MIPKSLLMEIYEQPLVAGELIRFLENSPVVLPFIERMTAARNLYLVGSGSSYHACILGSLYLAWLAGRTAIPVLTPQFSTQVIPTLQPGDVAIFINQSGETKEVLDAEKSARIKGCRTLGLINAIGSTLTNFVERYLLIFSGNEMSGVATKAFTNQAIALLYLSLQIARLPSASLIHLPGLMEQTLETIQDSIYPLEDLFLAWPELYFLGFGGTFPIALEGALKVKQTTCMHCEGMLSTEFKHGALAGVVKDYPVLFITGPADTDIMLTGLNEVVSHGGRAIVIGEENPLLRSNSNHMLAIPQAGLLLSPITAILPIQMLAYRLGLRSSFDSESSL